MVELVPGEVDRWGWNVRTISERDRGVEMGFSRLYLGICFRWSSIVLDRCLMFCVMIYSIMM